VSEDAAPERTAVNWSPEARADLRAIDRETAIQILHCVDRYLSNRTGDVKKLKPPETGFSSPLWPLPCLLRSLEPDHHRNHRRPPSTARLIAESTGTSRWSSPESKSPLAKSFVLLEAARN